MDDRDDRALLTVDDLLRAVGIRPREIVSRAKADMSTGSWDNMTNEARVYHIKDVIARALNARAAECRGERANGRR